MIKTGYETTEDLYQKQIWQFDCSKNMKNIKKYKQLQTKHENKNQIITRDENSIVRKQKTKH